MEQVPRTISISKARELLGVKYTELSDDQILDLVATVSLLAKEVAEDLGSKI